MNVLLNVPIDVQISIAKFVVSDSGKGTIEFTLLGQPVRLNIDSSEYVFICDINVGDRVKLISEFAGLSVDSEGVVEKIIPDITDDKVIVLFDTIIPDQEKSNVNIKIQSFDLFLRVTLPLRILEKL